MAVQLCMEYIPIFKKNVNTKVLWRKVGSKLILNTPKMNDQNQKKSSKYH